MSTYDDRTGYDLADPKRIPDQSFEPTRPRAGVPAILAISSERYHADELMGATDGPSLNASLATILCTMSPAHAKAAHPRLNPSYERKTEDKFDVGTIAHSLLLEGESSVEIIDAPDWRQGWAKEARDLARAHGRIPLLGKHFDEVQAMVAATRSQLEAFNVDPPLFTDGKPEQTLVWEEQGVTCRARLDWLRDDRVAIDDYKTTSRSANPETWSRTLFGIGADIQAAFYLRGLAAVREVTDADQIAKLYGAEFRWVVQETAAPYALSVVAPGPDVLTLANAKVDYALELWRKCLAADSWPAYPTQVCWAELPAWEESRWLAREDVAA